MFAGVTFAVEAGGALLLTGPNGSGKSSLLRMLAGLHATAGGEIRIDDSNVQDDPDYWRRTIAFVGHHDPVKPVLTVREHLGFWAAVTGGGDVDVGSGLVHQVTAGLSFPIARGVEVGVGLGRMNAFDKGSLDASVVEAGIAFYLTRILARR